MTTPPSQLPGTRLLQRSGLIWYLTAAVGQLAFVWMIANHYGGHTLRGDYPGWNDKPIIKGYVEGDVAGNIMFAVHVLLAAVITVAGLMQLIPQIRKHVPALHRWTGRLFLVLAYIMALGGLWLGWVRGTRLSLNSDLAVTLNGILILIFASQAWRLAAARRIDEHRQWAMRTFIVVNGVWFLRIAIMAWAVLTRGWGLDDKLGGPVGTVLTFGAYLIPLAVLELYFLAQRSRHTIVKRGVSALVLIMTVLMAVGIFGAIAFMWGPYM
ncbi:DUF2306 domain-containing protein [Asticcacaulis biprosthecium]|nr:DUF2306 domain-containing protein [Asticcacaulis biprosthecium]